MTSYYVYIMSGHNRRLYVGVTNDLVQRIQQHKSKSVEGFTKRYNLTSLVHYEQFGNIKDAIAREKQIKGWLRVKKIELIEVSNPGWFDLASNLSVPEK